MSSSPENWRGKRLLLSAGPTREALDPVRYLSNASSGRMGAALAAAALARGAQVDVVLGPCEAVFPAGARLHPVVSAREMDAAMRALFARADAVIAAAAVCDWRPAAYSRSKLKKRGAAATLRLVANPDIIAGLGARNARLKKRKALCAFALETGARLANARQKLAAKRVDLVVANGPEALQGTRTSLTLVRAGMRPRNIGPVSKTRAAGAILDALGNLLV